MSEVKARTQGRNLETELLGSQYSIISKQKVYSQSVKHSRNHIGILLLTDPLTGSLANFLIKPRDIESGNEPK